MRPTLTLAATAACLVLAGCAGTKGTSNDAGAGTAAPTIRVSSQAGAVASATSAVTASTAMAKVVSMVHTARQTLTLTAATDPNHLLGRPGQYTSDVRFTDSRVHASDTQGLTKGDVQYGGAVEVFSTASDAITRSNYIQAVTKALPSATEYDFVHGDVLIRVSHYLTPAQAAEYQDAVDSLG